MKKHFSIAKSLVVGAALMTSLPASGQISKIATADPATAVAGTKAFGTAYNQIQTQYQSFTTQAQTKDTEIQQLQKTLDTNNDNQLDQQEQAAAMQNNKATVDKINSLQQEVANLTAPRLKAERFAISQILAQYGTAQATVIQNKNIEALLSPDVFVVANAAANVTADITTQIDTALPAVNITPAAEWQPSRQVVAIHQQIQQLIVASAIRQRAQQQAAQQQGTTPAAQQPAGR